jgi:hypothetical protein
MGVAKNKLQRFLLEHPKCAFCGGMAPATTREHCPPRSMFENRHWPEGFEFPACEQCNAGSSNDDLLIAFLSRLDPINKNRNVDGKFEGIVKQAERQHPGLLENMQPSANEARRMNREIGIQLEPGQTHQEKNRGIKIPRQVHEAVSVFARKLAKAVYYIETKAIFPNEGCLLLNWFSNSQLLQNDEYPVFEYLKPIDGYMPPFERSGKDLGDQFKYKISMTPARDYMILQARFGGAFGFVVMGCTLRGKLETGMEGLRQESEKESPFTVLQASTAIK